MRQKVLTIQQTARTMKTMHNDNAIEAADEKAERHEFFDHSLNFIIFLADQLLVQLDGDKFLDGG